MKNLTPRQSQIVRLASLGCSTSEVASILGISESTAATVRAAAMRRLGTDKATLLTRLAIRHKITSMRDTLSAAERRKSGRGRRPDGWNR